MWKITLKIPSMVKFLTLLILLFTLSSCKFSISSAPSEHTPETEDAPISEISEDETTENVPDNTEVVAGAKPGYSSEDISEVNPEGNSGKDISDTGSESIEAIAPITTAPDIVFEKSAIPEDIKTKMWNVTISEKSVVTYEDLSYLTVTFMGYDGTAKKGNLIVDADIADEVLTIFRELYEAEFPIEKIKLPSEYGGSDELSMQDNNTSAFNDRPIEGSGALSYHQLGRAIDINPLVNPYIRFSDGEVLPTTAHKYLDRALDETGMIKPDSICVEIFKKYGWTWGGDWNSVKDYQHFEKK